MGRWGLNRRSVTVVMRGRGRWWRSIYNGVGGGGEKGSSVALRLGSKGWRGGNITVLYYVRVCNGVGSVLT